MRVDFYHLLYELPTIILDLSLLGCKLPLFGSDECHHQGHESEVINYGIRRLAHEGRRAHVLPYGVEHQDLQGCRYKVVETFLPRGQLFSTNLLNTFSLYSGM